MTYSEAPPPVYTPYCLRRMRLRGITPEDVAAVLAHQQARRESYAYRQEVYGQTPAGRTLKVVLAAGSRPPLVLTVMPLNPRRVPGPGEESDAGGPR